MRRHLIAHGRLLPLLAAVAALLLTATAVSAHPHVVGAADPSDTEPICVDGDPVGQDWLLVHDPLDTEPCDGDLTDGDEDPVGVRPVELANAQNHGPYQADGTVCGGDPAAYGLETAHHGPDAGTAGNADGCFQVDSMPPGSDDHNPAID
jgi:hypothetical protein